jgi:hypothetical protein
MKKPKGYMRGGMMRKTPKGMSKGGKMPMARDKDGEMKPAFLVDDNGMRMGGMTVPKTKGYFKGGKTMSEGGSIGGGLGKKGEKEKLEKLLQGSERSSGYRNGPLKKEDITATREKPILKKSDITKTKKPASKKD